MHIIGITGPTGCGKTTLLRVIEVHGGFTVDCDALYYEMLRENAPMRAALTEVFGDIFLPDGSLDRPKLGNRVFSDTPTRWRGSTPSSITTWAKRCGSFWPSRPDRSDPISPSTRST